MPDLEGKICVITGGGQGLGYACAEAFAAEGAQLAILDLDSRRADAAAEQLAAKGSIAIGIGCDVQNSASVRAAADTVSGRLGVADVLINNAGIGGAERSEDHDEAVWDAVVGVSLKGTFLCSREFGKQMIDRGRGGNVVNMSSIMGLTFMPTRAAYASAKAAIIAYTKVTAGEWARHQIRVNALAPGYVLTEGVQGGIDSGVIRAEPVLDKIPAGRMGTPAEIAAAALYLASDRSSYVTGHVLVIDGGYTSYGAWWPPADGSDGAFAGVPGKS